MYGDALMIGFESNHEVPRDSHPYQTENYIYEQYRKIMDKTVF